MADYDRLLAAQNGCCAICRAVSANKRTSYLHVDHDHISGQVRGLLCSNCNNGIGRFGDDAERLRKAADYLERAAESVKVRHVA